MDTPGRRLGKKVVELHHVSKSYGDRPLIKDFSYLFRPDERVGIIGGNGVGKSTLLELITQRLPPDSGRIEQGITIAIGYFDQHSQDLQAAMHEQQRVIDYIKEEGEYVKTADGSQISASQMLERFMFLPNQHYAPIQKLSGGEKRRLFLLRVLMSAPNLLILDEPTNDLDVMTLTVLEDYLEAFNGCVIIVSHDRYFLDRCVSSIIAFEGDGQLHTYTGNYSDYVEAKAAQQSAPPMVLAAPAASPVRAAPVVLTPASEIPVSKVSAAPKGGKLSYKEKREYEQLEQAIPQMERDKAELEHQLYGAASQDYTQVQAMAQRLADLNQAIEDATERWMSLAERDPG
ncbi:MAG: hypothetical protein OHK0012_22960 [Synechococcales cyanobacterium]